MILTFIALAAAFGFNYVFFDQLLERARPYFPTNPLIRTPAIAATGAVWQTATTFAFYTPLWLMGLQAAATGVVAWWVTQAVWQSRTVFKQIRKIDNIKVESAIYDIGPLIFHCAVWYVMNAAVTFATENPMYTAQCGVAVAALVTAVVVAFGVFNEYKLWIRIAAYPLLAIMYGRFYMLIVDAFIADPIWLTIATLYGLGACMALERWPDLAPTDLTPISYFIYTWVAAAALHTATVAAWYWPTPTAVVMLALAYTWFIVSVKSAVHFVITYIPTQIAVVLVLRYPWLLTPLPFIGMYYYGQPARAEEYTPSLDDLQSAYDYHRAGWTNTSHRINLAALVQVPEGEESTWHRYAANYYREVLQNQYFLDLPEVTADEGNEDDRAREQHRKYQELINDHIRCNFRHLRRNLRTNNKIAETMARVCADICQGVTLQPVDVWRKYNHRAALLKYVTGRYHSPLELYAWDQCKGHDEKMSQICADICQGVKLRPADDQKRDSESH